MRVGKFKVPERMLNSKRIDQKYYLRVLFTGLFITESSYIKAEDKVLYKAIGDQFDDIQDGEVVPEYEALIDKKSSTAIFKRIDS